MLSITVRPRQENFKLEWKESLIKYFSKKEQKYIVAVEKGNHFQCCWATTKRADNCTVAIKKLLQFLPEDDDEKRQWLKVRKHNNPKYLIGYCVKEGNADNIWTNYSDEEVQEGINVYERIRNAGKKQERHNWKCTSVNSVIPHAYRYCLEWGKDPKTVSLHHVCVVMAGEDLLPVTLVTKIKYVVEDVWEQYCLIESGADFDERWETAREPWLDRKQ